MAAAKVCLPGKPGRIDMEKTVRHGRATSAAKRTGYCTARQNAARALDRAVRYDYKLRGFRRRNPNSRIRKWFHRKATISGARGEAGSPVWPRLNLDAKIDNVIST
jgi:hypothetical protein